MIAEIILLVLGIPSGLLLAWLARDELVAGRRWFLWAIGLALISGGLASLLGNRAAIWFSAFVVLVTFISYIKSFNRAWTRGDKI